MLTVLWANRWQQQHKAYFEPHTPMCTLMPAGLQQRVASMVCGCRCAQHCTLTIPSCLQDQHIEACTHHTHTQWHQSCRRVMCCLNPEGTIVNRRHTRFVACRHARMHCPTASVQTHTELVSHAMCRQTDKQASMRTRPLTNQMQAAPLNSPAKELPRLRYDVSHVQTLHALFNWQSCQCNVGKAHSTHSTPPCHDAAAVMPHAASCATCAVARQLHCSSGNIAVTNTLTACCTGKTVDERNAHVYAVHAHQHKNTLNKYIPGMHMNHQPPTKAQPPCCARTSITAANLLQLAVAQHMKHVLCRLLSQTRPLLPAPMLLLTGSVHQCHCCDGSNSSNGHCLHHPASGQDCC